MCFNDLINITSMPLIFHLNPLKPKVNWLINSRNKRLGTKGFFWLILETIINQNQSNSFSWWNIILGRMFLKDWNNNNCILKPLINATFLEYIIHSFSPPLHPNNETLRNKNAFCNLVCNYISNYIWQCPFLMYIDSSFVSNIRLVTSIQFNKYIPVQ